jgi:hypothetical protein
MGSVPSDLIWQRNQRLSGIYGPKVSANRYLLKDSVPVGVCQGTVGEKNAITLSESSRVR